MRFLLRRLALPALAVLVAGCATVPRFEAAGDVRAFLVAIRDGDRAGFDAHVDRPALKAQLKSRLIADQAAAHGDGSWQAVGAALFGDVLVDAGVDAFVQPATFRAVALRLGYAPDRPLPNRVEITEALRQIDPGHVCVVTRTGGPCTLVFRDEDGVWRLIGYEGEIGQLVRPRR